MHNNPDGWYLGLDQASYDTGIAIAHGYNVFTTAMSIKATKKHPVELVERCHRIEQMLGSICEALPLTEVFTESTHTRQMRAYTVLVKVETTIHNYLYRNGIPYSQISPNNHQIVSWPRLLQLGGTKEHVRLVLDSLLPELITEHELDAIGVLFGSLVRDNIVTPEIIRRINIVRTRNSADLLTCIQAYRSQSNNIVHTAEQLSRV